ncbi:MAG: 2-isopropylmalate synthase/homocitrate synthase family protein [Ilumatobacteraceae bacterium]|nr:2-isopropylmalate synthase/homocitrate synthase family protein [Ilumatobacteraceae bacterium]
MSPDSRSHARPDEVIVADDLPARDPGLPESVEIYDTTLRDGAQLEGISLTVDDKLRIADELDELGVHFIEGGWPGANPKDIEFFDRAARELRFERSLLVAFGSTRRPRGKVDDDPTLRNLLAAQTSAVCIVGKSSDFHVTDTLKTTLDEGEAMVADSVAFLQSNGVRVLFDAEHFFDGWKHNPEFSLRVLEAAAEQGAETLVLCDTNGGSLPHEVEAIVREITRHFRDDVKIGVHLHDDTGCGVANALAAVRGGAIQVQGTMNGYGERTGNCNLTTIIPNLTLKMGVRTLPEGRLTRLTSAANRIAEIVNFTPDPQAPYVGSSAFAHKAGLHVSAIARRKDAYEHVDPAAVGNDTRFVVSEMAGKATIDLKAKELGLDLDGPALTSVIDELKRLEHEGYHFEAADGSLELLMRRAEGWTQPFFELESYRVIVAEGEDLRHDTEAIVKLKVNGERIGRIGEGNGPVNALDAAVRAAIGSQYPQLAKVHLTDFKVRVLDTAKGTGAVTRVLIDSTNGRRSWSTIGVSENIIQAAWQALEDSLVFGLLHTEE